jgi:hypothetical protein
VSHGVPSNYLRASRLGADGNACLALARALWHTLSKAQKKAIIDAPLCNDGRMLLLSTRIATCIALEDRGIVEERGGLSFGLTGLGAMVREAGVYTLTP